VRPNRQDKAAQNARFAKMRSHVQSHVFDVYKRVLETAPFITSVQLGKDAYQPFLTIQRDGEMFELRVMCTLWTARVVVEHKIRAKKWDLFFKPYFTEHFKLSRMNKLRRSALILRKKLEMYDIHVVLNS
jgi:hypothetical protein